MDVDLANSIHPTLWQFRRGYAWYMTATASERADYIAARLRIVKQGCRDDAQPMHSSGSSGAHKYFNWGPGYVELYDFLINDLIRSDSEVPHVAVLHINLVNLNGGDCVTSFVDRPNNRIAQRWATVSIRKNGQLEARKQLVDLLVGYDLIIPPSHFEILDSLLNLAEAMDKRSRLLFTGEAPSVDLTFKASKLGFMHRDWMRCWDGGATFFTCQHGGRHWIPSLATVRTGNGDRLISTDLFNSAQPFIDYWNGDLIKTSTIGACCCGNDNCIIELIGAPDAYRFLTPAGLLVDYGVLIQALRRSCCTAAGLEFNVTQASFGINPDELAIEASYIVTADDKFKAAIGSEFTARLHDVGFRKVTLSSGTLMVVERKLRKIYIDKSL